MAVAFNAVAASPSVWDPNGSGDWSDPARWIDGNVPQANWQVRTPSNGRIYATDADASLLAAIKEIVLVGADSALAVTNDADLAISFKVWGEGRLEKAGAGTLSFDIGNDSDRLYCGGGCAVYAGTLAFQSSEGRVQKIRGPVGVYGTGVVSLNTENHTYMQGIFGDGTFRNDAAKMLELVVSNAAPAHTYVYSGTFAGSNLRFALHGGSQDLTGTANANTQQGRLLGGLLGITSFGTGNNRESSWGTKELVFVGMPDGDVPCVAEYLGLGQTTARSLYVNENARHIGIDGGSNGGLQLTGPLTFTVNRMTTLTLSGDHAGVCVADMNVVVPSGYATYMCKTGGGVWRFAATSGRLTRQNRGVVAVERGTLEYATMAEAGVECSLGDATVLHEPYAGARDDARAVTYAYLLGDGSATLVPATAVFRYIGTGDVRVTSRPVALNGAARFESAGGDLLWTGFSAVSAGDSVLTFGGTADNCFAEGISDGAGTLAVVKEGTGTWTLGGDLEFTGGVSVEGGTLRLQTVNRYSWFRFTVKKLYGDSKEVMLSKIALFAADGTDQAEGLEYSAACNGDFRSLQPGQVCLETADQSVDSSHPLDHLFRPYANNQSGRWGRNPRTDFSSADSNTWASIVLRLPDRASPVVRYDLASGWRAEGGPFASTPVTWTIEGSTDGVVWHEIESAPHVDYTNSRSNNNYWLSDCSLATTANPTGFAIASARFPKARPASLPYVSVAVGAVFAADEPVATGSIRYDAAAGAGTMSNLVFASGGVLRVVSSASASEMVLPYALGDCTGMDGLLSWKVEWNGRLRGGWRVRAVEGGLALCAPGLKLLVR